MGRVRMAALAFVLVLGGLGCATKQKGFSSVDEVFATYDADKNGVISREEFTTHWHDKQRADTAWKNIDTHGNGFVERALANDVPLDVWRELESPGIH